MERLVILPRSLGVAYGRREDGVEFRRIREWHFDRITFENEIERISLLEVEIEVRLQISRATLKDQAYCNDDNDGGWFKPPLVRRLT